MKMTKYTVMIDGDSIELEFDAVDAYDAGAQYLTAIGKRLVVQKTKDMLSGKTAITPQPNSCPRCGNELSSFPGGKYKFWCPMCHIPTDETVTPRNGDEKP